MASGELLKKLRMIKGFNQSGIAKKLGVSQQAYSKLEKTNSISEKKLADILKALDCSETELETITNIDRSKTS